ncbi:CopG family transcriptional regulator [Dapis sp. BLCC M229]|uniref:ribbon-helix-helix domain-containing protein n=1 Tax=Dapis sp. BLCC M229 TaxID=3400188 RepID=UPI003CEA2308
MNIQASRPSTKRMSVTLPTDVAEMLEFLARNQGISQNEAIRKAIATEAYFQKEIKQGSTVLIMNSDKSVKEVVFR